MKDLKRKIETYLLKKQLFKSEEHKKLKKSFLLKARKNLAVSNLLFTISEQEELKKKINVPSDFETYDWVIIISYYAMYASALAAIAKIGVKSKSHTATITVMIHHYVNKRILQTKEISKLDKAQVISEQLITKLLQTKTNRETAQYDATPSITREMAKTALNDAGEFITKIEAAVE